MRRYQWEQGKEEGPAKICVERGSNKSSEAQKGEVTVENLVPSPALSAKGCAGNQANKSWGPHNLL